MFKESNKTEAIVAAATGLRRGEFISLKWADIDFEARKIRQCRSVVNQKVGKLKAVASGKPGAVDPDLSIALANLQPASPLNQSGDRVFASSASGGKKPYWPDMALNRQVRPAGTRLGITKRIGWHSFRQTHATLLKSSAQM
jgi:integrase